MTAIGQRLKQAMLNKQHSMADVADQTGCLHNQISTWINKGTLPSPKFWPEIAAYIGITEDAVGVLIAQDKAGQQRKKASA